MPRLRPVTEVYLSVPASEVVLRARASLRILKLTLLQGLRLLFNLIGALALILLPLAYHELSTTDMFGIALGITWAILIVNVIGILPSKSALESHDHYSSDDPFHPERVLMVEEDLPRSGMPRNSMNSLHSRSSETHPESLVGTGSADRRAESMPRLGDTAV